MGKSKFIELREARARIPILYEDRSVIAIDKPAGWLCAPQSWERTGRNLQLAIESSIAEGDFWARSHNVKFLRFVHRLDGETSGVLLMAKSLGAVRTLTELFEERGVEKRYLAVVRGVPREKEWVCTLPIGSAPEQADRSVIDEQNGQPAETRFHVLATHRDSALIEAEPVTGRTHQIRVHLAHAGHPVLNDPIYGRNATEPSFADESHRGRERRADVPLALRSIWLRYLDPFQKRLIWVEAPADEFCRQYGFAPPPPVRVRLKPVETKEAPRPAAGQ